MPPGGSVDSRRWVAGLAEIPPDLDTYRSAFVQPARLATTLVIEREGEVIGDLMLRVEDAWAQAEVTDEAANSQAELGLGPGPCAHR